MKKSLLRVIATVAILVSAISANAALFNYNEQFDGNGMHFNLNFTADDTVTTVITNFNGTAVTDGTTDTTALTLLAPDEFSNDNRFAPTTLSATTGGWNSNGIGFKNTVSGDYFNVYNDIYGGLMLQSTMSVPDTFNNFIHSSSAVSSVPVPAAVWLFASGLGLLTFGRRKKITN
ncbi:MAG: hypothetical protein WCS87_06405 [Methylococcaceae bacterium]